MRGDQRGRDGREETEESEPKSEREPGSSSSKILKLAPRLRQIIFPGLRHQVRATFQEYTLHKTEVCSSALPYLLYILTDNKNVCADGRQMIH